MCGIVGLGGTTVNDREGASVLVETAVSTLAHRGPDGSGAWVSDDLPVALGHRRLAVLDLSDAGSQPMVLGSDHALVFNGEIYNFRALRQRLENQGEKFISGGDTEVLLRACRRWGVPSTLSELRGMFAFAYVDGASRRLWLARDRFGEKPLYYACWNGTLAFASELRALRAFPGFPTQVDLSAIEMLMRHSCISGEQSIYRSARKVLPGTAISVPLNRSINSSDLRVHTYWDPVDEAQAATDVPFRGDLDAAADELDELLGISVVDATVSDVPVGAFLSGGVDSTSVVSQLRRRSSGIVRTFTIGFASEYRSEAGSARRIAEHLDTDHTALMITAQDALDVIPQLPLIYDEPFADSSQIPTFLVAQLARQSVTVALSGDGGDELFAGYPRYQLAAKMWGTVRRCPVPIRDGCASVVDRIPKSTWCRLGDRMSRTRLRSWSGGIDERIAKLNRILTANQADDIYRLLVTSFWEDSIVLGGSEVESVVLPAGPDLLRRVMLRDTTSYLPGDILTKVDRAAMAVSLETRIPMLTPELFAFSYRLPNEHILRRHESKRVLRQLLARHVPRELWDGPKTGFSVPIGKWLRGPLHEWASELLSPTALSGSPLNTDAVRLLWDEHQQERRDWGSRLWNVLMFQAWCNEHHPGGIEFDAGD